MSILRDNDRILPNISNVSNYLLIIVPTFKLKIFEGEIYQKVETVCHRNLSVSCENGSVHLFSSLGHPS